MKPETERWIDMAAEDMGVAEAAWGLGYYPSCLFHCQQAIEKTLKAGLVEHGESVPKIHDLPALVHRLGLQIDREDLDFLGRLTEQYIPTRYGDARIEYPREVAENYFETTKRLHSWLLQQLS
jgi:HEPN domain-containing protein